MVYLKKNRIKSLIVAIPTIFISCLVEVKSAEKIYFVNGIFSRTMTVESIESFIKSQETNGFLGDISNLNEDNPKKIKNLLTQEFELPILLTSRLMNSSIGEVMIKRIAKIIYPLKLKQESISVPAIKSAVIKGLDTGKGKINLILFLKSYPNKNVTINIPALLKVLKKVESISDLVQFLSDSPLEALKDGSSKP